MGLLNLKAPVAVNPSQVANKVQKSKRKVSTARSSGNTLYDKINLIKSKVELELGHLKDNYVCIKEVEQLAKYIDACIDNNEFAFDTETSSLNYIDCDFVGFSL